MKIREIAELVSGEVIGNGDIEIANIAGLASARSGDLSFSSGTLEITTDASCVLVSADFKPQEKFTLIRVEDPKLAFAKAAQQILPRNMRTGWHISAHVPPNSDVNASLLGPFVSIGDETYIGEATEIHSGSQIGHNVSIGNGTIIHPNCVIYDGALIGDNCVIHSGVVIGADGFGYVRDENGDQIKFPQVGTVVIEDNVEIGANSCVDRGSLGETRIGEGTKIDNLVQIAHNVKIGKRVVIAAQTGVSGSTTIEDDCVIGGQVGIGDHARIQRGAILGSQAGILPHKIVRKGIWWGTPVQPLDEFKKRHALWKGLERMIDRIRELEKRSPGKR